MSGSIGFKGWSRSNTVGCDCEVDSTVRKPKEIVRVSFNCFGEILEWSENWLDPLDCHSFRSSFDNGDVGYELSWCSE